MIADTGQRKGFGVRDAAYIEQLADIMGVDDGGTYGAFLVAELDGAVVGATIVGTFGVRAASLYTASDERGRAVGAQHPLHWEAMLCARRRGCRLYDFRGIGAADDPSDKWAGMSFFKQRFGTRREDLPGAWDDIYRPAAYKAFLLAQDVRHQARRLPARRLLKQPFHVGRGPAPKDDGGDGA